MTQCELIEQGYHPLPREAPVITVRMLIEARDRDRKRWLAIIEQVCRQSKTPHVLRRIRAALKDGQP